MTQFTGKERDAEAGLDNFDFRYYASSLGRFMKPDEPFGGSVTINQANADYIIMLNRESKQNRGLLRSNNQVQVANRAGDILGSNATQSLENATKDAGSLIVADWQAHGWLNTQETGPAPAPQTPTVQPAVMTSSPAVQPTPAVATPVAPQPSQVTVQISAPAESTWFVLSTNSQRGKG